MIKFEFDITTDLVQKQKRSMIKDQNFMDIEVANELALAYRDKDVKEINDSVQDDTLVFLTDRQKYLYDKIQALPKGIDSIGLMIANNAVFGDESQNQTMMCTP
ncbi:MAG: hypothetical protein EZS28_043813 [Streblomastix strix]|uniref:Uncharacterized protein n=1 Tax=Streblomastix strix TaxID=222440 RepID=A0A5J4TRR9_9EUKA|nr:MAG: hypothetical protein EZS28_043813 [Streblomastix strix]